MSEPSTIARPYAKAVFRLAQAEGKLAEWADMLGDLAHVAVDARMQDAVSDPKRSAEQVSALFTQTLAGRLNQEANNFVRVLADNRRMGLLPFIYDQFNTLKHESEGLVEAHITSAFELNATQLAELVAQMEKHTGRRVQAKVSVDKALIGGVRIVIGDKVIDGSVQAQLDVLEHALKA